MDLHGGSEKKKAKQNKTESNKDERVYLYMRCIGKSRFEQR